MKLGNHWKIVQKISPRNTYDISLIEDEVSEDGERPANREACQENESIELVLDFCTFDMISSSKNGVNPYVLVTLRIKVILSFLFIKSMYFVNILTINNSCAFPLILIYLVKGLRHASGRKTSLVRFICYNGLC